MTNVKIGVGVILSNCNKQILLCKRISNHGKGNYSIPGGSIGLGEKIKDCAAREVLEETGIRLHQIDFLGVTNNLQTYEKENLHSISMIFYCDEFSGKPLIKEPTKHEFWKWYDINKLPEPHFEASKLAIKLLKKRMEFRSCSLIE